MSDDTSPPWATYGRDRGRDYDRETVLRDLARLIRGAKGQGTDKNCGVQNYKISELGLGWARALEVAASIIAHGDTKPTKRFRVSVTVEAEDEDDARDLLVQGVEPHVAECASVKED